MSDSRQTTSDELARWAAARAETCVAAAAADSLTLDYSPASVEWIEEWLRGALGDWRPWRRDLPARRHANLIEPVGTYVGEVIVRNLGGHWAWNEDQRAPGVDFGDESWAFPLHKTQRRFVDGPEDDLGSFYRAVELVSSGQLTE